MCEDVDDWLPEAQVPKGWQPATRITADGASIEIHIAGCKEVHEIERESDLPQSKRGIFHCCERVVLVEWS